LVEATWRGSLHGGPAVDLLLAALDREPDEKVRAALLGGLSAAMALSGRDAESDAIGDEAIALARRVCDTTGLLETIHNRSYTSMRPDTVRTQLALTLEGVDLARDLDDEPLEMRLACKALLRLFVVPDPPVFDRIANQVSQLAVKFRQPYFMLVKAGLDVAVALADGRLDEAEAGVTEYQRWADVHGRSEAGYGIQMFSIRREQGRLGELRPVLELGARLQRDDLSWAPGLAAVYGEIGMLAEGSALLDRLVAEHFASITQDSLLPGVLSYLADAAVACRHQPAAEAVLEWFVPYSGLLVYIPGLVCYGAADRYLGRLSRTLGRTGDATRYLEAALDVDERTGWAACIAHSRLALGTHLLDRRGAANRQRGMELLRLVRDAADSRGLRAVADRSAQLIAGTAGTRGPTIAGSLTPRELEVLRLVAQGLSNREAGAALHASPHTIANHMRAILLKTASANRTEASAWAFRNGLVGDGAAPAGR
ncbi:MAG: LuxR C-terminal-related transcriptional regulator, partial [Acidimicrobiia bacterium]|nr:LuxR C-terminal-related transcriptional regulator [Acidimicrobiia bacterium]